MEGKRNGSSTNRRGKLRCRGEKKSELQLQLASHIFTTLKYNLCRFACED
jgi:hypothetical protein